VFLVSISATDHLQTAVVKESLRIAHGVVTPLPRVVGPVDSEISGVVIPAGVRKIYLLF
jgi:cytochrome P450